jgi:tetratricopeptide (TPR) repeat protein
MHHATDPRGHALSSTNEIAVAACNAGIESFNRNRADAMSHLDAAIAADDGFALPRLAKAWMLQSARDENHAESIQALMKATEACLDATDDRDGDYLAALKLAFSGRGIESATILEALLDRYPTDLLAHRLVQLELFWTGRAHWMLDITERAAPYWSEGVQGYATFLSCRAFSNEEAGRYAQAERDGRAAIELDNTEPWGAHAIAHVLYMQGRHDEGIAWLEGLSPNWDAANQLRHHLWWHLCLFSLECSEHERILTLLTTEVRNPDSPLIKAAPDATIDIQNVASMLLRLELRGADVGDHWEVLADICASRVHNHTNAFSNFHDMMVLAATGQFEKAEELLRSLDEFIASGEGSLVTSYRVAGVAACQAVLAHRKKEYSRVIEVLSPVRHDLPLLGGSHAQRDVLYQVLIDASRRMGRGDLISIYLNDVRRIGFDNVDGRTLYREARIDSLRN